MGIKGLYSCLKPYSIAVTVEQKSPSRLALDAYPFLYKFRENIDACLALFEQLRSLGHSLTIFIDGTPPKEKMEELAQRRQQKEVAYQQAKALKLFLLDEKSSELPSEAKDVIEKQIAAYEVESWCLRKEIRELFVKECEAKQFPLVFCKGEADEELIRRSLDGEFDIVIANDMDLFVGGVERLWVLGKTSQDILFQEFRRSVISERFGIHPSAWVDVALLAGYEKTPQLKICSPQQAITYMRYYGCIERFFEKRPTFLKENTIEDYQKARAYFS